MSTPPVQTGPIKGTLPSLEWVHVDRLSVDPAYQRATDGPQSQRIITGMVKCWDWGLCQPLVVARRNDGSLWILDGQHRQVGAVRRGDIPQLPCVILGGIGHAQEAETFVALNTRRQRLSQSDIFNGMLAAGDRHAAAVQQLLEQTGWKQVRSRNTAVRRPGELECAPMLARHVATGPGGEDAVRFGLSVLIAAFPTRAVQSAATMLKGLFTVFGWLAEQDVADAVPVPRLIQVLAATDPNEWIVRGAIQRERTPTLSGHAALARVILDAVRHAPANLPSPADAADDIDDDSSASLWAELADDEGDDDEVVPPPSVPQPVYQPPRRLAPSTPTPGFGLSGKGWCDQCEQLVSREKATACKDRFCKLRGVAG